MRRWRFVLVAVALLGVSGVASAATFWDDFEAYADGSNLHGQAGWKGWDNAPGATGKASTKYAFSGKKSVEALGASDLVHEWKLVGGRYVFTIQQFLPKSGTGTTYFILMSKYVDGGAGNEWAVQIQFNMDTGILTSDNGGGRTAPIIRDEWVELKCVIDLVKNTVEEYYGGELISTHTWSSSASGTFQAVDLYGNGAASVYYDDIMIDRVYLYEASEPNPADGAIGVMMPLLRWTPGDGALFHDVYFSTSPDLTEADKVAARNPATMYFHLPGLLPGVTYFWRVDEFEAAGTAHPGKVWSFTSMPLTAYGPTPADGAEGVPQAAVLTWSLPLNTSESHVYFSDDLDAVTNGDAAADKGVAAEATFSTGLLRAGTTYFWRVDVKDGGGTLVAGPVWSFTTDNPVSGKVAREWWSDITGTSVGNLTSDARYPANPTDRELVGFWEGPVNWADNYGSRLYGWITPPKSGDYTFWIASDDMSELWLSTDTDPANGKLIASVTGWVASRDFDNTTGQGGASQKSAPVALQAGNLYFMQALMKEGGGGDNLAVAWQGPNGAREIISGAVTQTFALPPLKAAAPSPGNGTIDVVQAPVLSWYAGEGARNHQVYFGDDAAAVAAADTSSPLYQGQQSGTTFKPGDLEWGKTFFWRVDEVAAGSDQALKGTVWRFTTAACIIVDDFETYNDEEDQGLRIYETWIDGWADGSSGSTVGYTDPPFAERTKVWNGKQSMPFDYNNVNAPYFSEVRREYTTAQNWTAQGMDTLVLHVRGGPANKATQPLYITLTDKAGKAGTVAHPNTAVLKSIDWVEWKIPLSQFGVNAAAIQKIIIGVGIKDKPVADGSGRLFIDAIRVIQAGQ